MTPEQQSLITKAQRSLNAAKSLAKDGDYDFAVSRAYYAMFYVAQALLMSKQLSFSTHSGVINAFGLQFIKSQELPNDYHRALITAERVRLQGDYDSEDQISAEMAQQQIQWAERFLELQTKAHQRCSSRSHLAAPTAKPEQVHHPTITPTPKHSHQ